MPTPAPITSHRSPSSTDSVSVVALTTDAEIALAGEIDIANCSHIPRDVDVLCRDGHRRVRLNMRAVSFIDCTAAHALIDAFERAHELGCSLSLSHVGRQPRRVLRLLALDALLVEQDPCGE